MGSTKFLKQYPRINFIKGKKNAFLERNFHLMYRKTFRVPLLKNIEYSFSTLQTLCFSVLCPGVILCHLATSQNS